MWKDGVWEWEWRWRRGLFEWENGLIQELQAVVGGSVFHQWEKDRWVWKEDLSGMYYVKAAYRFLMRENMVDDEARLQWVWNRYTPLKVSAFAWKMLQNRIPTKDNLIKRGVLTGDSITCAVCSHVEESVAHLFFECDHFSKVWVDMLRWLGVSSMLHNNSRSHLLHFEGMCWLNIKKKERW